MSQARFVKCSNCQSLAEVICSIDKKLTSLAYNHYKNIVFETTKFYSKDLVKKLTFYKRILTAKLFNPSYTDYKSSVIISRVKVLLNE